MASSRCSYFKLKDLISMRSGYQLRESKKYISENDLNMGDGWGDGDGYGDGYGDGSGQGSGAGFGDGSGFGGGIGLDFQPVKYIQVRDVDRESMQVDLANVRVIPFDRNIDVKKYAVDENEFLFLSKGSKPGAFTLPQLAQPLKLDLSIVPMSHFFICRPKKDTISAEFFVWALNQKFMEPQVKKAMAGSGIPFIPKPAFLEFEIPVPSREIQNKITNLYRLRLEERRLVNKREKLLDDLVDYALTHLLKNQIKNKTLEKK